MAKGRPLTLDQRQTLEQLVMSTDEKLTDKDIADKIGVSEVTVARYRKKVGLKKTGRGKLVVNPEKISRTSINQDAKTVEEKETAWKSHFMRSKRYQRLINQYLPEDLEFFVEQWVKYHIQLEDMTASEEDALENLIIISIRINENQKGFREAQKHEQDLRNLLGNRQERELDLENEEDRLIFELITSNNRNKLEINKDLKDLRDSYEKTLKILNATREQREAKNQIGADTFLSLIRHFNDRDRRREVGKYNERLRIATEKQTERLKKVHTFIDGTQEAILLDGSDFKVQETKDETEDSINNRN